MRLSKYEAYLSDWSGLSQYQIIFNSLFSIETETNLIQLDTLVYTCETRVIYKHQTFEGKMDLKQYVKWAKFTKHAKDSTETHTKRETCL